MKRKRKGDDDEYVDGGNEVPDKPHPFERMMKGAREERQVMDDQRFEDGRVEYLLRTVSPSNSKHWIRQVRSINTNRTSDPHLTFAAFAEQFPTFPYVLGASRLGGTRLHADPRCFIPSTFKAFRSTPFMKEFEQFYEEAWCSLARASVTA